ncbi:MAG: hypothetical protein WC943_13850 [Elusimicrobiota bacterium]|jgi:hypothetical protein
MKTIRQTLHEGGEIIARESAARPGRIGFLGMVLTLKALELGPGAQRVELN